MEQTTGQRKGELLQRDTPGIANSEKTTLRRHWTGLDGQLRLARVMINVGSTTCMMLLNQTGCHARSGTTSIPSGPAIEGN